METPFGSLVHDNRGVTVRLAGGGGGGVHYLVIDAAGVEVVGLIVRQEAIELADALAATGLTREALGLAFLAENWVLCRAIYHQLFDACRTVAIADRFYAAGRRWADQRRTAPALVPAE